MKVLDEFGYKTSKGDTSPAWPFAFVALGGESCFGRAASPIVSCAY